MRSSNTPPVSPSPQQEAEKLLQDPALLRSLLQSSETKALIQQLSRYGDLSSAAQAAKAGDPTRLKEMLSSLERDPKGHQTVEALERKLGR